MTEDPINEMTIHNLLIEAGFTHNRDEFSSKDSRHQIWRGKELIGRFTAGEAVDLLNNQAYLPTDLGGNDERR